MASGLEVTSVTEMTIDGRLSTGPGVSSKSLFDFYGQELSSWFHARRAAHDLIMVGAGTVRCDDPMLTVRHVKGPSPIRLVPTSSGNLPPHAAILTDGLPTILIVPETLDASRLNKLTESRPALRVLRAGREIIDFSCAFRQLAAEGHRTLMVEGGSRLLTSLFSANLVDRIVIKHLPILSGSTTAPTFLSGNEGGAPLLSRWRLDSCEKVGGIVITEYLPEEFSNKETVTNP